jgi:hypothetical protein
MIYFGYAQQASEKPPKFGMKNYRSIGDYVRLILAGILFPIEAARRLYIVKSYSMRLAKLSFSAARSKPFSFVMPPSLVEGLVARVVETPEGGVKSEIWKDGRWIDGETIFRVLNDGRELTPDELNRLGIKP